MDGNGNIEDQDKQGVDARFKNLSSVNCTGRTVGQWLPANPPLGRCSAGLSVVDYFGRTLVERLPEHISVSVAVVAVGGSKIELFDKDTYQSYIDSAPSWMLGWISEFGGYPYGRLVEVGKKAQQTGVIKGILLHQGESNNGDGDKWLPKVQKIYENLIKDLALDPTKVPLLAGEMVGQAEGGACWYHNQTIAKLPTVIPNSKVISSSGLPHKGDNLHFTSASYRTFGVRYAEAMLTLLDTTPVVVVPAPRDTVFNGNFEQAVAGWKLNVWAGSATGAVVNGEYKIDVTQIGSQNYQIQLIQAGLILEQGKSYQIRFDAYAEMPRNLEFNVEQDVSPWTSYLAELSQFELSTVKQSYTHKFTMTEATDSNSRLSFNAGSSTGAVFLDNIRLEPYEEPVQSAGFDAHSGWRIDQHNRGLRILPPQGVHASAQVSIHDLQGRLLLVASLAGSPAEIDVSHFIDGMYLLHLQEGTHRILLKPLRIGK